MPFSLERGSVVLRRGRYGIVWRVQSGRILVHPVTKPARQERAGDVELSFAEIIACGIEMPVAVVRCGQPIEVDTDGQAIVGAVAGALTCRLSLAVARATATAEAEERWIDDRRHRERARAERPVRMNG